MRGLREANIGLAVMMVLSIAGFFICRGMGEAAVRMSVWFSVFVGGVVFVVLSIRDDRRRDEHRDQ